MDTHRGAIQAVNTKPTRSGTVYEVTVGNELFSTFNERLGEKAQSLYGSIVTVSYELKVTTKGDRTYTNKYLKDLTEAEEGPQGAERENAGSQVQGGGGIVVKNDAMPPEREARIVRQSAMKTAFAFVGQLYAPTVTTDDDLGIVMEDATERAFALAAEIYKMAWGGPSEAPSPPTPEGGSEA